MFQAGSHEHGPWDGKTRLLQVSNSLTSWTCSMGKIFIKPCHKYVGVLYQNQQRKKCNTHVQETIWSLLLSKRSQRLQKQCELQCHE